MVRRSILFPFSLLCTAAALALLLTLPNAFAPLTPRAISSPSSANLVAEETALQPGDVTSFEAGQATGAKASLFAGTALQIAAGVALLAACRGAAAKAGSLGQGSIRLVRQARGGATAPLVVIAGPPAAGKGTQCEKIKEKFGYVHISTGDILRANVKEGTELGKKASEYMTAGKLVPSELIVDLVKDRLAQPDVKEKGCLLDGFPRAPDQAKAMVDAGITVDKFILIEVPDDTLVERGCGRRLDPETGEIYHLKFKPPPDEIVDRLVHRSDDQEEAIRERLAIYHEQVNGITPFFTDQMAKIDGLPKPAEVTTAVFAALE